MRRAISDTLVLTGRNLVHLRREPLRLSDATVQPVLFTLLFIYVIGAGIVLPGGYKEFAIAGLLAMNLVTSAIGTAVGLSDDLNSGVIDRFRTLAMWKPAVLVGRSLTDLLTAVLCGTFVVLTGLVIGWRPHADAPSVLAAFGIFALFAYAISWGCACIGLYTRDAEASQGLGLVILFPLAIISNALVPTAHMTAVVRAIADWNPVSAVVAAGRKLLGNVDPSVSSHAWPMQHPVIAALGWSVLLLAIFAPLAVRMYQTRTAD
jgi:ABC-type polysaccharide/polyol phosphate export permease